MCALCECEVIEYVQQIGTTIADLCTNIKSKSRSAVGHFVQGSTEEVKAKVEWLLKSNRFTFGGLSIEMHNVLC